MFRKLITNLSFSPTLISEVARYAARLKREEKLRRIGLFLLVPAIGLQTLALVRPPESPNTASKYDLIYGGVSSLENLLYSYNRNVSHLRDRLSSLGITASEVQQLTPGTLTVDEDSEYYLVSAQPLAEIETETQTVTYQRSDNEPNMLYVAPLDQAFGHATSYEAFVGNSRSLGEFFLLKNSGSIVTSTLPPQASHTEIPATIVRSLSVVNETDPTSGQPAKAGDRLTYTLHATNTHETEPHTFTFMQDMADVLEYADVITSHGAAVDANTHMVSWPTIDIPAGESEQRQLSVRLKAQLPATAQGTSNPHSFDCTLRNTFGVTTSTPIDCPMSKHIEAVANELPRTAPNHVVTFLILLACASIFYYLRALQQKEEVRLIRRDTNEGALL